MPQMAPRRELASVPRVSFALRSTLDSEQICSGEFRNRHHNVIRLDRSLLVLRLGKADNLLDLILGLPSGLRLPRLQS